MRRRSAARSWGTSAASAPPAHVRGTRAGDMGQDAPMIVLYWFFYKPCQKARVLAPLLASPTMPTESLRPSCARREPPSRRRVGDCLGAETRDGQIVHVVQYRETGRLGVGQLDRLAVAHRRHQHQAHCVVFPEGVAGRTARPVDHDRIGRVVPHVRLHRLELELEAPGSDQREICADAYPCGGTPSRGERCLENTACGGARPGVWARPSDAPAARSGRMAMSSATGFVEPPPGNRR